MAMEMPQMISKSFMKPSAPTPKHLKTYNLSVLDQIAPHFYLPIVLFYPAAIPEPSCNPMTDVSSHLKKSLSETLTHYYPFAGRVSTGKDFIDCNDEGVDFYEARMDSKLADVLEKPDPETMDLFSPPGMLFNERFQGSPIIVQITYFSCGGIALSISMLHKVTDACGLFGFCKDWAAVGRGEKVSPVFLSQVISPFCGDEIILPDYKIEMNILVTRRFTFDPLKLAELKAIVANTGMLQNPSRVEVVAALIYMRAMSASKAKSGISSPSMLIQLANIRRRVVPPLPENSIGNFCWYFSITSSDEKDNRLESIVAALRKSASGFYKKFANGLSADGCYSIICESAADAKRVTRAKKSEIEIYNCSSLCGYSFNQMDFGWGKPIWVGASSFKMRDTFHLFDSVKSGGIEAQLTLEKEKMAIFENDEELLRFAMVNSSAIYG